MEGFPYTVVLPVRFRDLDAMGHVNHADFLTFFEVARTTLLQDRFGLNTVEDIDFLIVRAEVDYLRPVQLQDRVEIGLRISQVGNRSFEVEYLCTANGEPAAKAKTVQAFFDAATQKSKPVPDAFRAAAAAFSAPGDSC